MNKDRPAALSAVWRYVWRSRQLHVLMVLPLLYLIVFKYAPMYGAIIAFKDFNASSGIWGSSWVGMENFSRFVHSYQFWTILRNTLVLSVYQLVAGFPFPILLALSLNYVRHRFFKKTVQMITYAPHFISVVVIVGILLQFLDPRIGMVNHLRLLFGLQPIDFIGKPNYFSSIYVWSAIWQNVGFNCIIFLAALASIDPSLHEAAVVDGANKFHRMRHIDLPGIMPIAVILLILNTGHIMDIGFEKVLLLQNPLNLTVSEVIDTYVYKIGLASPVSDFSYSTAIGLFKSVIGIVLLTGINRVAKSVGETSLW